MTTPSFFTPVSPSSSSSSSSSTTSYSFKGSTLVIPAVSIGSVPQLAVDLLLHHPTLQLRKVGRLDPSFCFPFVGPSDSPSSSSTDLTTALEVFSNPSGELTVIQQRSPVFKSRDTEYISSLTTWIKQEEFGEVLWLTSIDAAMRTDAEFETPVLSLLPRTASATTPVLKKLTESFPPFTLEANHLEKKDAKESAKLPVIPGSLLTRKLFNHLLSSSDPSVENGLNLGALLYFAAEGDTRADAHELAHLTLNLVSPSLSSSAVSKEQLTEPPSWKALFGRPAESSLYA